MSTHAVYIGGGRRRDFYLESYCLSGPYLAIILCVCVCVGVLVYNVVCIHPDHGFLNYDGFVKLDDSDFELEDVKELLAPEMPIYETPRHGYNALEILHIIL